MKSIIFTLALFSCGQESVESIENKEIVEIEDPQKADSRDPNTVLLVCENENTTAIYDRDNWGNWSTKGDLQNVRHQVLLEETLNTGECEDEEPTIQDDKVVTGCWKDQYTNMIYKDSTELDIDHLVPLKEAFESGAHNWTKEKKKEYYNYIIDKNHLLAVESGLNRSKGSKDVAEWLPEENIETYVANWIEVKHTWNLSIDSNELEILKQYSNDTRLPNTCQ